MRENKTTGTAKRLWLFDVSTVRLLSFLLTVSLVFAAAPALVLAAETSASVPVVTNVTDTSAQISGNVVLNVEEGETFDVAGFAWAPTPSSPNAGIIPFYTYQNTYSTTLTGLSPNTKYYVRTFIKAKDRERVYSEEFSFTTQISSISATVEIATPTVTTLTPTSARVQSSFNVSNGTVAETGFVWSTAVSDPALGNQFSQSYIVTPADKSLGLEISNIGVGTVFYVKAYVKLSSGLVYYSAANTNTAQIGLAPTVTTVSAVYSAAGYIAAQGTATTSGSAPITERGFVYSTVNIQPTLNDVNNTSRIISSSSTAAQVFDATLPAVTGNIKYYVRAYAVNAYGAAYGNVAESLGVTPVPMVTTEKIENVTASGADITINVTSAGDSPVTEKGVIYSKTNARPELYAENAKSVAYQPPAGTAISAIGSVTMNITGLESNTVYYVRAYARNAQGTSYGEVRELSTGRNANVSTVGVANITATTATASGNVVSDSGYTIQERGFVISATQVIPALDATDVKKAPALTTGMGAYSVDLTELAPETKYYIRAYVKTTQTVSYGETQNFTTLTDTAAITVTFSLQDSTVVGTQVINITSGKTLSLVDLQTPFGFAVIDPGWKYTVKDSAAINVLVRTTAPVEKAYMKGDGSYQFAPNRRITRIEIAEMIYLLLEGTPRGAVSFSDIPVNYQYADALSFVVASRYMQGDAGMFRPNNVITRAEVATVLCNVFSLTGDSEINQFSDVTNHWGRPYINIAAQNKLVSGRGGGIFDPDAPITKAESSKMFAEAAKRSLQPLGSAQFVDVPATEWYYPYIMNAAVPEI
ncbi:MAG: S-layer homology domain-containing protein [Clostridiales bacterium]|jgi:hypothetical protein|nr:S-layer homology domain-containing protein [Clostridiales bacterium]